MADSFEYTPDEEAAIARRAQQYRNQQAFLDDLDAKAALEKSASDNAAAEAAARAMLKLRERQQQAAAAPRVRTKYEGPDPDRASRGNFVSKEELADFQRKYGADKTLRDLLNADRGRGPSAAMPAARGVQGANIKPAGPRVRPDEAATLPPVGLRDIPGLIMQGMQQGAQRVPAGRGVGAAFVGAGLPRAAAQAVSGAKLLRDHPSITPERRQMLKEMEDYVNVLNQADRPARNPAMRAMEERVEPPFKKGGKVKAYAKGGSVKGSGCEQRGLRKCKIY